MTFSPHDFSSSDFVDAFKPQLDRYVSLRIAGRNSRTALRVAFGEGYADSLNAQSYVDHIECNAYYSQAFNQTLARIPVDQLWNRKTALHRLLSLAEDPYVKDNVRALAIKELNILVGITVEDENGKPKQVRTLDDFYKDIGSVMSRLVPHAAD